MIQSIINTYDAESGILQANHFNTMAGDALFPLCHQGISCHGIICER